MGLANYYRRFIPDMASEAGVLNDMLQDRKSWKWTDECETAFTRINESLISDTVLTHFDPKLPLLLATDASPTGLGAELSHGEERPIAYVSRSMSKAE